MRTEPVRLIRHGVRLTSLVALWIAPGILSIAGLDGTAFARGYDRAMPEGIAAMVGAFALFLGFLGMRVIPVTVGAVVLILVGVGLLGVGNGPDLALWVSVIISIIIFISGLFYFRSMEKTFADTI